MGGSADARRHGVIWPMLLSKQLLPLQLGTELSSACDRGQSFPLSKAERPQGTAGSSRLSSSEFCEAETSSGDQINPSSCQICLACCHQPLVVFQEWSGHIRVTDTGQHKTSHQ